MKIGTFTDPRDGNIYNTIVINGQTWLAENLRYRGPVKKIDGWAIEEKDFYYPPNGKQKNISNMVVSTHGIMLIKLFLRAGICQHTKNLKIC